MKKNIWIINHHANGMYFDEGGRHYSIAKYLKRKGYNPVVFCANAIHGKGEYYFEDLKLWQEYTAKKIGVPFVFIKSRKYSNNGKDRILGMLDFYFNMQKAAKEYVLKHEKPDIIIGSSVHPLAVLAGEKISRKWRIPCICEIRDLWPESIFAYYPEKRNSPFANLMYSGEKYMYKHANAIVMTWPGGKDYIEQKGWLKELNAKQIYHISNGVDLEVFDENLGKESIFDRDLNDENMFKIVYAGSVRKVNNLNVLIDVAEKLQKQGESSIKLIIYGDGDELESLKQQCELKNITNILFKGRVSKTSIPCILKMCDCTIMHNRSTELNKFGQSQNKFFEYLAAGKPVIMTYSVGYSICEAKGCGIEVKEQTPERIVDAIIEMSKMESTEYEKMCKASRRTAEEYDFKELTDKYIDVIESI